MNVDPITFAAQVVNFLVLMAVLYFALFRRIIRAMDKREQGIRDRIEDARKESEEARKRKEEYQKKIDEIENQRSETLKKMREEVDEKRSNLLKDARKEVETQRKKWQTSLEEDKKSVLDTLDEQLKEALLSLSRRMLRDLTGENLQAHALDGFVAKLEGREDGALDGIFSHEDSSAQLVSATELSRNDCKRLEKTVGEYAGLEVKLDCRVEPDLGIGVELRGNGRRFGWSLESYAHQLRQHLDTALAGGSHGLT